MKVPFFKEYSENPFNGLGQDVRLQGLIQYVSNSLQWNLKELSTVLRQLDFENNFSGFIVEVSIAPNSELAIRNQLRGLVPSKRVILRGNKASKDVTDGESDWTQDYIYLKNHNLTDTATITVAFMK